MILPIDDAKLNMSQKSSKFVFVKETQLKNFVKNITPHVFYHLKIYIHIKRI